MTKINSIIKTLKMFSTQIMGLQDPVLNKEISIFENKYEVTLPNDYKLFLEFSNGLDLMGTIVYGINPEKEDLDKAYSREHYEVIMPMNKFLVPFAPDGRGNYYCFDTEYSSENEPSCKIVFWVSNYNYHDLDTPEVTHHSFLDWVQECIIEWTLEDYDYEGNPRME